LCFYPSIVYPEIALSQKGNRVVFKTWYIEKLRPSKQNKKKAGDPASRSRKGTGGRPSIRTRDSFAGANWKKGIRQAS
jgi:hypothetical protein